ncbi:MAG: Zn-ribbon domain-containing OB-fold protein [Methanobacteriota archaeon]|nr:MAG: Zn-ribbon domain-containing OB-fold protein [Euryarchaeota archaeon]
MGAPRFWRKTQSRYNLYGVKCKSCNATYFPPRKICPSCRRASKLEDVKLTPKGEVLTYTVIRSAPEGFERQTPYIMAIVKLDEGPMVTTQIVDCEPDEVEIGMAVEGVFRKIRESGKDGPIYYGFKFRPARADKDLAV